METTSPVGRGVRPGTGMTEGFDQMPFLPLVHLPHVSHRKLHSGLSDPSTDSSKAAKASIRPRHLTLERMQGLQGGVGDQVGDGGGGRGLVVLQGMLQWCLLWSLARTLSHQSVGVPVVPVSE